MVILVKIVFQVSKSATIINIIYLYIVSKMTHPKMKMTILTLTTLTRFWRLFAFRFGRFMEKAYLCTQFVKLNQNIVYEE